MNEAGLPEKWRRHFQNGNNYFVIGKGAEKGKKSKKKDQRITLNNMSGSFVVLLVGIFSSIVVVIIELTIFRRESSVVSQPLAVQEAYAGVEKQENTRAKQKTPIELASSNAAEPDNESNVINISADRPTNIIQGVPKHVPIVVIHNLNKETALRLNIPIQNDAKKSDKEKMAIKNEISDKVCSPKAPINLKAAAEQIVAAKREPVVEIGREIILTTKTKQKN